MKYLVIEIQKFDTGAMSTPTWAYDELNSAQNSYVSQTAFNRIYAFSDGKTLLMVVNLDVDASPGTTFRTIGSVTLPENIYGDGVTLSMASQSGNANLLIYVSPTGTIQIFNAYGSATGWYRQQIVMPFSGAVQ